MKIKLTPDLKTALIFFIFGCLWIFLSDFLFLAIVHYDLDLYYRIQVVKGLSFILFASILIYYVSRELHRNIEKANQHYSDANNELTEALERYNMLTMATRDAIWDFNLVTKKSFVNSTLLETFGYPISTVQDNQIWWEDNLHPQDKERVINGLNEAMDTGRITWQDEYLFRCADGTYKKILDRSFIMHDENGKVYRIIGAMQDVTPQRHLQEQLFDERIAHEKELSQIILSAQERERRRIALELHDNINQLLTTIKLHIDLASANTEKRDEILAKIEPMINNVINEVRMLSRELAPSAITDLGLSDSLKDMASTIQRTGKVNIDVDTSTFNEDKLSTDKKLTLYRIAQEQLNNIIKYSKASEASIRVFNSHNHVQMEIRDNGIGFNVHTLTSGAGFSNMRSRLEVFNGKLHLISAPGKGCELIINL